MNKLFKKMIAFILIFAIMTTSINLSVFADIVSGPIMYNNTSYDTIEEAVNKATEDGDENPVIYLKRNIEFGGSVTLSENQHMTISSNDENKVVISFTCNTTKSDTFFTVPETANLTFQNIDVEGNRVKTTQEDGKVKYENKYAANKSFIIVKGKVVLNNTIFRNFSVNDDKSIFELNNGALEMDKNSGITECDNQGIYASNALIRVYNKGNITGGTVSNVRGWYDIGVGCVFYSNDLLEVSDVNISNVVIRVARAKEFTMNNCDISEIYSYGEAIDAEKLYIKNSKFYHNGSHYGTSTLAFDYGEIINTSFEKEYVRYGWTNILVRKRAVMAGVKFVNNRNDIKIEKNASVIVKEGKIDSEKFGKDIEVNSNEFSGNSMCAFFVDSTATLIVEEGTFSGNNNDMGGAINNQGNTILKKVSIFDNKARNSNDKNVNKVTYGNGIYNNGTLEVYSLANIQDQIMLGEGKIVTVKEKLMYPIDIVVEEIIGDEFRAIAQYETEESEADAYINATEAIWKLSSVTDDKQDNITASGNRIGLVSEINTQNIKCVDNNNQPIEGVNFTLWKVINGRKYKMGITGATNEDGILEIVRLQKGDYSVTLDKYPDGYYPNEKIDYLFTTSNDNTVKIINLGEFNAEPTAIITLDKEKFEVGETVNFSAAESYDDHTDKENLKYSWDFGDGKKSGSLEATHKYYLPGTYVVILTITDEKGRTNTAVQEIEVEGSDTYRKLKVRVESTETGELLTGVDIYVLNDNNEAIWKNSNKTGILEVYLLPGESYSVYAEDKNERYLPRQSKVIMGEEDKEIVLYLSTNDTVKGKVTASEMTYGEIKEAGIDMDCDDNQRIIKYEVTLVFGPKASQTSDVRSWEIYSEEVSGDIKIKAKSETTSGEFKINTYIKGNSVFFLIVDGTTKYLCDMFHVQLVVFNTSTQEFITDCEAKLCLPDGLALAKMIEGKSNEAIKKIGRIDKSSEACADWYVRGEKNGDYKVSTIVTGKMDDGTGETEPYEFIHQFESQDILHVTGEAALELKIAANSIAFSGKAYPIRMTYTNVSDKTLYGLKFFFDREEQKAIDGTIYLEEYDTTHKVVNHPVEKIEGKNGIFCERLLPEESFTITYVTTIEFSKLKSYLSGIVTRVLEGSSTTFRSTSYEIIEVPDYDNDWNIWKNSIEHYVGEPVNLYTGGFTYKYTDIIARGRHELTFERNYDSRRKVDNGLGIGWSSTYDYVLTDDSENDEITVSYPNGEKYIFFNPNDNGIYESYGMCGKTLKKNNKEYILTDVANKLKFDCNGKLISIIESDGWETVLTYNNGLLENVSSDAGEMKFIWESTGYNGDNEEVGKSNTNSLEDIIKNYDPAKIEWDANKIKVTPKKIENHIKTININGENITFTYNGDNLDTVTNLDKDTMSFSYDDNYNLISIKDFENVETIKNIYDRKCRVTSQVSKDEGTFTYTYDDEKYRNICKGDNGYKNTVEYDENGAIIREIAGDITEYTYNGYGKVVGAKDSDGIVYTAYDNNGNIVKMVYQDGTYEEYTYQNNLMTSYTNRNGEMQKYVYSNEGLLLKLIDANNNSISYEYDVKGNLVKEKTSEGIVIKYTYNKAGLVATKTDGNGNVIRYTYDDFGRTVKETDNDGNAKEYTYSRAGKVLSESDENKNTIKYKVNKNGFITETVDTCGNSEKTTYNAQSKITTVKSKAGYETKYVYDKMGNVTSETDALGNKVKYTYDSYGNVTSRVDENDNIWMYSYDKKGRLKSISDPYENKDTYIYDDNGWLISKKDANGNSYSYEYDGTGKVLAEIDEEGNRKTYNYDSNGNLITETDFNNNVTVYTYDGDNRLKKLETDKCITKYTYDNCNNVIAIEKVDNSKENDKVSKILYTYDFAGRVTSFTNANNSAKGSDKVLYTYDKAGNLATVTKQNGTIDAGTITYTYDGNNNLVSLKNERGYEEKYVYDEQSRLVSKTDANGEVSLYEYDCDDNLTFECKPNNYSEKYEYDAVGKVKKMTYAEGKGENYLPYADYLYEYDKAGRLISEKAKDSESKSTVELGHYTYDKAGNVKTITDGLGNETSYEYNKRGDVTAYKDGNGNVTRYSYDGNGNIIKKVEANNNEITFVYDSMNNVIEQKESSGKICKWEYDASGNITKYVDSEGHTTKYEYDLNGNNTKIVDAKGNYVSMEYNYLNLLSKKESNGKLLETYSYDNAGNLIKKIDSNGTVYTYEYSATNQITKMVKTSKNGKAKYSEIYSYDKGDNLSKITYDDGTEESFTYNGNGDVTSYKDKNGNKTLYSYSYNGNLVKVTKPDGNFNCYSYDENNNLTVKEECDAKTGESHLTNYSYDANGNCTREGVSLGEDKKYIYTYYKYDCMNNLISVSDSPNDAKAPNKTYKYDLDNNVIEKTEGQDTITYCYDKDGNLISMITPNNEVSFDRDNLDRIVNTNQNGKHVSYEYDADGNKSKITYSDGKVVSYEYDGNGNIISLKNDNKSTYFTYDYLNNITEKSSNGVGETYKYDNSHNLVKVYATEGIRAYLIDNYEYDANGNIINHKESGRYTEKTKETKYEYDVENKLTKETIISDGKESTTKYEYDGFGNLISETKDSYKTYCKYNHLNQLIEKYNDNDIDASGLIKGIKYSYDSHGNLASINDYKSSVIAKFSATYNENGQIKTAFKNVNTNGIKDITSNYEYDGSGNLIKEANVVQSLTNKTSTETQYIYDYTEKNPTVLSEIKNNGVTIDYAYGCDNKKTDVTVDTNILYKKTHETYSVSTDIIGSTRWAFDSIGNVCASTEYDAWGNVTENSGLTVNASVPTVNITKSYTGHIYDEGTRFWNAGAREYDPFTKRFTSMDPENGNIYMPETLHKYSYASNNPVMNVDLNGRFTTSTFEKAACSAVKAAIGGIYTFTETTVNVWNDFNNLIDRIPAPVKAAVAIAGTGVSIASGVAPGAAVLTMAMAMGEGAAVNLAFYAVGSYVTGKQMTWKDAIKTAGKGALDGAFLNGIGQGIAGAGRILVNNKAGIKNFYVDETGSVKIDGLSDGKSGSTSNTSNTLYHYTNKKGMNGIIDSNQLNPSLKANNPKDARYGNGQYLSDITPDSVTPGQLGKKFINVPNKYKYTNYVEIDVSELDVVKGRGGVFVIPNKVPLDLTNRIISYGKVGQ